MQSSNQPSGGHERLVWHCYVDGRIWRHCHFIRDEDGNVWPLFDAGYYPNGKVTLVLEPA